MPETPRLLLRMLTASDFDAYAAMHADEEVTRFTARAALSREEAFRHMAMLLGHWQLRGYGFWAVEEKATGAFVGRVGFHNPEGWPGFELGWSLAREHWGKGFASEAASAALEHAFTVMNRDHVISLIDPANVRSIAVAERLGESLEGETFVNGHRVLIYGISR